MSLLWLALSITILISLLSLGMKKQIVQCPECLGLLGRKVKSRFGNGLMRWNMESNNSLQNLTDFLESREDKYGQNLTDIPMLALQCTLDADDLEILSLIIEDE